ncbi:isocitrate dehydrogenase [NAD] subunit gamma, mitochondrial-like [Styela clava]
MIVSSSFLGMAGKKSLNKALQCCRPSCSLLRNFSQYGGRHTITMIPGDGIGPEIMKSVERVFTTAGVPVDFEKVDISSEGLERNTEEAIIAIKRNEVAIKGNIDTKFDKMDIDEKSANMVIRTKLDLFANVLKVKSVPDVCRRNHNVDIRIIRENTEGEYSSLEHESMPGVVESLKIITAEKSYRIAKFAFEYARRNKRKKITAVHKANIMKLADGLFLQCCRETARDFPDIEFNDMIVDNTTMQLVSKPEQFDVMVMPNLYGNIVGNICCGLVGGPGMVAGSNIGDEYRVFEPATRNTGSRIAGLGIANPNAMLFASTLMLKYIGLQKYASLVNHAIIDTILIDKIRTPDIGGTNSTEDVTNSICMKLEERAHKVRHSSA